MHLHTYRVVRRSKYWKLRELDSQVRHCYVMITMTYFSAGEGLFTIIDACPRLATLDLTRCRGVAVADRRRFFEVSHSQLRLVVK